MTIFKAIILGIIQGVAEFLPISSSAHLIVFPYLFGWEESSLAFDVALHFGTMMAVLVIFFKDWWNLFIGAIKDIKNKKKTTNGKMFWYLVVATIPAAIVGFLLDDVIENVIIIIWLIYNIFWSFQKKGILTLLHFYYIYFFLVMKTLLHVLLSLINTDLWS
mgnify:CR=1 FL=1